MFNEVTQSPFQVGGSLPSNATSYVKRLADDGLFEAVQQGHFCYVFNARQMGKSSLRVQAMQRLIAAGNRCVSIDLTTIGTQHISPEQWYASFAAMLVSQLHLRLPLGEWWRSREHLSYVARLSELIDTVVMPQIGSAITIFIDEVDSVLGLPFTTHDFFGLIRNYYNRRADEPDYQRLTFVLLGVTTPTALIQDKRFTPFNIGQAIELSGFQLIEAMPLLQGLSQTISHPQTVLKQILFWTGGQPFMTQKVCQLVIEYWPSRPNPDISSVVQSLVQTHIIDNWESQDEPEHLRTIRDRLLHDPQHAVTLLTYYQKLLLSPQGDLPIDNSDIQRELILSGLVQAHQGRLKVKNPIYESVFNQDWIDRQLGQLAQQGFRPKVATLRHLTTVEPSETAQTTLQLVNENPLEPSLQPAQAGSQVPRWAWGVGGLGFTLIGLTAGLVWQGEQWKTAQKRQIRTDIAAAKAIAKQVQLTPGDSANLAAETWRSALFHAQRAYQATPKQQPKQAIEQLLQTILYRHSTDERLRRQIKIGHDQVTQYAGFVPGGKHVWLLTNTGELGRWKPRRPLQWAKFPPALQNQHIKHATVPEKTNSLFASDTKQQIWRLSDTGAKLLTQLNQPRKLTSLHSNTSGDTVAAIFDDGQARVWRYDEGQLFPVEAPLTEVIALQFIDGRKEFITHRKDGKIHIHKADTSIEQIIDPPTKIQVFSVSSNGDFIVAVTADQTLRFWSATGKLIRKNPLPKGIFTQIAVNSDSSLIAVGRDDGQIQLYNLQGSLRAVFPGNQKPLHSLSFGANSRQLLSSSYDHSISLWDVSIAIHPEKWMQYICPELQPYLKQTGDLSASDRQMCN